MMSVINKIRWYFKRFNKEHGMSLVEVVVMIVVLGLSIGPLSKLAKINLNSGAKAAEQTKAVLYAKGIMEHIIADYRSTDASVGGFDNVITNWNGVATETPPAGLSGNVTVSSVDTVMGVAVAQVNVNVTGSDVSLTLSVTLSN